MPGVPNGLDGYIVADKHSLPHFITGLCSGSLIPVSKDKNIVFISINLLHLVSEWLEYLRKDTDGENYGALLFQSAADCVYFLLGSLLTWYTFRNLKSDGDYKKYIKLLLPVSLCVLFWFTLCEVWSSAQYIGDKRYGDNDQEVNRTLLFMMSLLITTVLCNILKNYKI
jgi:hypothetical protein